MCVLNELLPHSRSKIQYANETHGMRKLICPHLGGLEWVLKIGVALVSTSFFSQFHTRNSLGIFLVYHAWVAG